MDRPEKLRRAEGECVMKRLGVFAVAAWAVLLAAMPRVASAALVTYSTEGSFNGNPFATNNSVTVSGLTLTYNGVPTTSVDANPTTLASFGSFTVTGSGTATFDPVDFDLRFTQTAPSPGTGAIDANLSGTVSSGPPGSSSLIVTFTDLSAVIGGVVYTPPVSIGVPVPGQSSTVIGRITFLVPEPASLGLLSAAGLLLGRRRR
jgi:hypothetical protein